MVQQSLQSVAGPEFVLANACMASHWNSWLSLPLVQKGMGMARMASMASSKPGINDLGRVLKWGSPSVTVGFNIQYKVVIKWPRWFGRVNILEKQFPLCERLGLTKHEVDLKPQTDRFIMCKRSFWKGSVSFLSSFANPFQKNTGCNIISVSTETKLKHPGTYTKHYQYYTSCNTGFHIDRGMRWPFMHVKSVQTIRVRVHQSCLTLHILRINKWKFSMMAVSKMEGLSSKFLSLEECFRGTPIWAVLFFGCSGSIHRQHMSTRTLHNGFLPRDLPTPGICVGTLPTQCFRKVSSIKANHLPRSKPRKSPVKSYQTNLSTKCAER